MVGCIADGGVARIELWFMVVCIVYGMVAQVE